jgi:hypothetical protein
MTPVHPAMPRAASSHAYQFEPGSGPLIASSIWLPDRRIALPVLPDLFLQEKIRPKRLRFRHLAQRSDRITLYILARLERCTRV